MFCSISIELFSTLFACCYSFSDPLISIWNILKLLAVLCACTISYRFQIWSSSHFSFYSIGREFREFLVSFLVFFNFTWRLPEQMCYLFKKCDFTVHNFLLSADSQNVKKSTNKTQSNRASAQKMPQLFLLFLFSVISSTNKVWLNRCVINMLVLYMVCAWDTVNVFYHEIQFIWVCRLLYFASSYILSLSITLTAFVCVAVCCYCHCAASLHMYRHTMFSFFPHCNTSTELEWDSKLKRDNRIHSSLCMWRKHKIAQSKIHSTCDGTHKFTMQLILDDIYYDRKTSA